ncbi:MAG: glycosyltransferase family 39 protein [Planctomycetota bacterium]|nr:MAG: glycosyltransferase family 39 protein [Planctomycetota bacterium]
MITEDVTTDTVKRQATHYRYWAWVALVAVILLTAAVRVRLLDAPLERDEGEYAYAGQLILQGIPPYAQVYNMKMPGIYAAYALILAAFGQTHSGIHLGLLIINAATVMLLFLLAKRLFGPLAGVAAAAVFALLSLGQQVQGIFANAEHFVVLAALGGLVLLLRAVDCQKWPSLLAAAVLLGLAFIMKQHGAAFIIFGAMYLLFRELSRQPFTWKPLAARGGLFLLGVLLPFAVTCLVLWGLGVFGKFWFWTFDYARQYVSATPLSVGLENLQENIIRVVGSAILLWILAGVGLSSFLWNKNVRQHSLFVCGLLFFSFLAVCPGLYFRPHYFILLLPAVSLLAGIGAAYIQSLFARSQSIMLSKTILMLLALVVLSHASYQQRIVIFQADPRMISRIIYGANPFPESLEVARFIKERSDNDDTIAVIGSEPQIYFYSNRRAATGYIYTYALMEKHSYARKMQEQMILEVESARPEFLVLVNVSTSWLARPDSEKVIFEWLEQYTDKYYRKVGIIDIISQELTVYRWGRECEDYVPRSSHWVSVLQRKGRNSLDPE